MLPGRARSCHWNERTSLIGLDLDGTGRTVGYGTAVIATPTTPSSMTPRFGSATDTARWPWWVRGLR
jgi:hypothetical protein